MLLEPRSLGGIRPAPQFVASAALLPIINQAGQIVVARIGALVWSAIGATCWLIRGSVAERAAEELVSRSSGTMIGQGFEKRVFAIPGAADAVLVISKEQPIDVFVERRFEAAEMGLPVAPLVVRANASNSQPRTAP